MDLKPVCKLTHGFILAGTCPWCDSPIIAAAPTQKDQVYRLARTRWNMAALSDALDDDDEDVRHIVCAVLLVGDIPLEESLPILRKALKSSDPSICREACDFLVGRGFDLLNNQVSDFEDRLSADPFDYALRILVLASYFTKQDDPTVRKARYPHILWIIEHAPELPVVQHPVLYLKPSMDGEMYSLAKQLLLRQVEMNEINTTILSNAAGFFAGPDTELSVTLLKRTLSLEPDNCKWHEQLGRLYKLQMSRSSGSALRTAAKQALTEFEKVYEAGDELERFMREV